MEASHLVKTAAALLVLAALGGLPLAGFRLAGRPYPPAALAMAHGFAAGAALTLLLYAAFTFGVPTLTWIATAILVGAGGIGAWLNLGYHSQQKPIPLAPMTAHIIAAAAGVTALVAALIQF